MEKFGKVFNRIWTGVGILLVAAFLFAGDWENALDVLAMVSLYWIGVSDGKRSK